MCTCAYAYVYTYIHAQIFVVFIHLPQVQIRGCEDNSPPILIVRLNISWAHLS